MQNTHDLLVGGTLSIGIPSLFIDQVDVQQMPMTYITYNPDSRDNMCVTKILITLS